MELKVWVEGIQRIVCGVTVTTTCQDVVFALAHATGKVGRFTLIERWRNNERLLAPNENPLKLLLKWGEYANDVQFILQLSENKHQQQQLQQQTQRNDATSSVNNSNNNNNINSLNNLERNSQTNAVMLKKPLGLSNNISNNSNTHFSNNSSQSNQNKNINNTRINNLSNNNNNIENTLNVQQQQTQFDKVKEFKRSAFDTKPVDNIGVVKGIPQNLNIAAPVKQIQHQLPLHMSHSPITTTASSSATSSIVNITTTMQQNSMTPLIPRHEKSHSNPIEMPSSKWQQHNVGIDGMGMAFNDQNNGTNNMYHRLGAHNSKSINEINLAVVRDSLNRRIQRNDQDQELHFSEMISTAHTESSNSNNNTNATTSCNVSNENLLDIYNGNAQFDVELPTELYNNTPTISANGALVPPPYRDPPPPRNSPQQLQQKQMQQTYQPSPLANDGYGSGSDLDIEFQKFSDNRNNNIEESESIFQASQYSDLLQLIKYQREKISSQQMELSKYDAEIIYLENKERDHAQELEAISREITQADQIFRQGSEQLQALQYVEEENELVKQQEKTLKSEIALLRSKLSNCETELLQCKNKIRLLMDDIEIEQKAISNKQKNNRQNFERDFLMEMERIQSEIDQAIHNTDASNKTAENLKKEILLIENAISEKKRQVEQLVKEMKEVNLQSLTVTTSEEIKYLLEGTNKTGGSTRRIIGSPRQLENAVPTSKNPHGVWV